jgi:hypothetical protein
MKVTSFQDVPHSPKRMRIQTHAVRLYIRAFSARRAFRRTPRFQAHAVRLYIRAFAPSRFSGGQKNCFS